MLLGKRMVGIVGAKVVTQNISEARKAKSVNSAIDKPRHAESLCGDMTRVRKAGKIPAVMSKAKKDEKHIAKQANGTEESTFNKQRLRPQ